MAVRVDDRAWGVTYTQHQADALDMDLLEVLRLMPTDDSLGVIEAQAEALRTALEMLHFEWPKAPEGGDEDEEGSPSSVVG